MEIKIQNKTIKIGVIPIKEYSNLLKQLKTLPKYFNEISGKTNNEIFEMAPEIITNCLPDILAIFEQATGVKKEDLENYGLADLVDIFVAVIQENRFVESIDKLKKGFTLKQKETNENLNILSTQ